MSPKKESEGKEKKKNNSKANVATGKANYYLQKLLDAKMQAVKDVHDHMESEIARIMEDYEKTPPFKDPLPLYVPSVAPSEDCIDPSPKVH